MSELFATSWTAAYQAPPSMGFSSQEYWSGVPLPSPLGHMGFSNYNMWASVVLAPRLQSIGSKVVMHRLICSKACGISLDQGLNWCLLYWKMEFSTAGPPGKFKAVVQLPNSDTSLLWALGRITLPLWTLLFACKMRRRETFRNDLSGSDFLFFIF